MLSDPAHTAPQLLTLADHRELEQALYREARLLDEEDFDGWLAMTTDDVVYRMPLRGRRFRKDRSAPHQVGGGFVFNDTKARLALRIGRLKSGFVWAEDPQNYVRRIVANIEITALATASEARVRSVITIHRNRMDSLTRTLTAGRDDIWREVGGEWLLAHREANLDHSTVPDSNLNVFF
jgi:3-phenylpropionate/trans-cinnamate dioxygenase beta subunit